NPYWQNPKWYERDRPLFGRYLPLIKRVAEAGWHPLTHANSDNPAILIERFGPAPDGSVYLTFFNDTAQPQSGVVSLLNSTRSPEALVGDPPQPAGPGWRIALAPDQARVWSLSQ